LAEKPKRGIARGLTNYGDPARDAAFRLFCQSGSFDHRFHVDRKSIV